MTFPALDKTITFLTPILRTWNYTQKPLIISVSGPQGSGKSYLSSKLIAYLQITYPTLRSITISTDDLYLTHEDQMKLTQETTNPLLKGRGLPGTHDVDMAYNLLSALDNRKAGLKIPQYDKSQFQGEGDRAPQDQWISVDDPVDIVVLEGWFNGFVPFDNDEGILEKYNRSELLKKYELEHLYQINSNLSGYIKIWDFVDVDIFYDTDDINNVYEWRIQQEHELIKKRGAGMTDEQARLFVDRYMVVYDLYYRDFTRMGIESTAQGKHLRLKIDKNRAIEKVEMF